MPAEKAAATGTLRRVLIANRGEIAVRVARACREVGIASVAVYSDADAGAPHTLAADTAVRIGAAPAADSYLNAERILAAARDTGADAIHPGYGFLSEQPDFAQACADAGLIFIGPSADAMRALGDKQRAKDVAAKVDVPTVPTWPADAVPDSAFPVLVKAAAGGGGRGMRVVNKAADLAETVRSAQREAAAAFGSSDVLIEKLVQGAHHVEVQIIGDLHGTVVAVGDRDCSLQRRHQKVIEEAPAPGLSAETHQRLAAAAIALARHVGYANAGTAEFLVTPAGEFYFLELNARLQVEHPVTELAFGVDLVRWQLAVAAGAPLDPAAFPTKPVQHAIEARVCAEDPVDWMPTTGTILAAHLPCGAAVRVDHAIAVGQTVSLNYDSLLAKVIATGPSREQARRALDAALAHTTVLGLTTNIALLRHAIALPAFASSQHDITTLEASPLSAEATLPPARAIDTARAEAERAEVPPNSTPFRELAGWRVGTQPAYTAAARNPADISAGAPAVIARGDAIWTAHEGHAFTVARDHIDVPLSAAADGASGEGAIQLTAPMPGTVIEVVSKGARVDAGQAVVVLEAMKMENAIKAPFSATIASLHCEVGDLVGKGMVLAELAQ